MTHLVSRPYLVVVGIALVLIGSGCSLLGTIAGPPVVVPDPEPLFSDDFSSADATVGVWSARRGHGFIVEEENLYQTIARVEDGKLHLVAPAAADWGALIVADTKFDGAELADYAIEARMAITRAADPPKDHQVGIVLWTGNEERSIFFYRMARGLFSFDRSAPQDSREVTHDDGFRAALGEMFDVRVEVRGQQSGGSEARFYVNGEFVGSRNLGLVEGAGKIGLYVYDAEAEFDHFRVIPL